MSMHSQNWFTVAASENVHNVTQAQALLHGNKTDVFGDAGYQGVEKRAENLALPVNRHIAMRPSRRKALDKSAADELMEKLEHAKASCQG